MRSVLSAPAPVAGASLPPGPGSLTATQRRLGRDWRLAALFLAPTAVLVGGLVLVPIARSIITSTTERHGQDSVFVGLGNYIALIGDDQFHTGLVNSFIFTAYVIEPITPDDFCSRCSQQFTAPAVYQENAPL